MNIVHRYRLLLSSSLLGVASCGGRDDVVPLFRLLPPDSTGITFANTITTNDSVNVQKDSFVYNGGGVAIGDIDNDGLPDIFLTGNMVSSRLYVNKGDLRFDDITESAGVMSDSWDYGASMVDINSDGYLDIYVSVSGPEWSQPEERANLLFINNGDLTFTEAAAAYHIDDTGFTTHGAFSDYDGDGHLDLFLLTNAPGEFARGEVERRPLGVTSQSTNSHDRLYRNNGDGTFSNVSAEAGILRQVGFGLGVAVTDLNGDGWPDIYVSNDDTPSDFLYVNNGDGTFSNKASTWLKHTSFSGMGVDIADFNNDGWFDILQTDMVPEDLRERKRMTGATTYAGFMEHRNRGFQADYTLNVLQLNNGVTRDGDVIFSEIAQMAGIAYTSWTWSPLFVDLDNDGYKDILVTNGYPKAVIDYDHQLEMHALRRAGDDERALEALQRLHSYLLPNYVFRNEGDLTFSNKTSAWGMDQPSFSYGAAFSDLDLDGRLDVVINNIDAPAFVYHNVGPPNDTSHYLQIDLEGEYPNRRGLGSKLILTAGGQRQYIYHMPYRGYQSSMHDRVHFGLGDAQRVDSLTVVWPDGRHQVLTDLEVDRVLTVREEDAIENAEPTAATPAHDRVFQPMDADRGLHYVHQEKELVDYFVQPLLPHMVSRQGPPLAVGDVTGNGLDDVFIGGAAGLPGTLFVQRDDGSFIESTDRQPWVADADHEDWGALFFDADGNGLLDLYVASGGYHLSPVSDLLQDRLYINQGDGRFARDTSALPLMPTSTATVTAGDFTGDGRPDLFVGGRLVPRNYPYPTRSYLLRNEGGSFTDITEAAGPELVRPGGMITDAVWADFTGDDRLDLVTAGVWMAPRFYENDGERLRDATGSAGLLGMRGWWYSIESGDFNGDGLPDLVAGNLGLNHPFRTSAESRFGVYADDFTGIRTTDIIFTQEIDGTEYPFFGFAKIGRDIYTVGVLFSTHAAFADASIQEMFSSSRLARAVHYQADTFASAYLQNDGDGTFTSFPLPNVAQISPISAIIAHDVDADGNLDLIVAGNLYHSEPNTTRADAGNGLWLRGDGRGTFTPVTPFSSGFLAPLQVADLALITTPRGKAVLAANNGDSLQAFTIRGR
ncbi:MAG: VCBS repeat-containing protein [Gemmatimonadota bacterium]|nr:MAG: VCBS repeat-containing protein [Gemmatimonadota bacterium]